MKTFGRVLVALDGSSLAERGLRLLGAISGPTGPNEVALLRVVAPRDDATLDEARAYLDIQREAAPGGSAVLIPTVGEDAATEILETTEDGYDLVVLMTHGRGGLKRWAQGSVAERVVRHCPIPLLLGNARTEVLPERIERILVPLDGSEHAASVLGLVKQLAPELDAEVVLVSAYWIDPHHRLHSMGFDTREIQAATEAHVADHEVLLKRHGISTSSVVALNEPAELILKAAESTSSDLIAMTTHGRSGVRRWVLGSVAEKVLRVSPVPVLLARVG